MRTAFWPWNSSKDVIDLNQIRLAACTWLHSLSTIERTGYPCFDPVYCLESAKVGEWLSSTVKRSNQVKEDCAEHSESTDLNTLNLLILDVVTTKVGLFIWLRLAPRLVWQCLRPETFSKPKIHRCSRHRTEPRANHTSCAMTDAIFMRGISVTLDKANNKSIPNRGYLQCGCI